MADTLDILAPARYPWRFNGPKGSRHNIDVRPFAPINKIAPRYEGATVFQPFPMRRFDLVHAFNRIPIGPTPYVIGFESHLPRAFWFEDSAYYRAMMRSLASDRCRGIVAISRHAETIFLSTHADSPYFEALKNKLQTRLPNVELAPDGDQLDGEDLNDIRLTFVGSHFARKGGCVAVRLAEMARRRGVPLSIDIVSNLECGGGIWTDPTNPVFFKQYLQALDQPNIRLHRTLPNKEVLSLLRHSHFSLLTTFSDTFGYSAVESMMNFTPVIATRQGALPEFITDGVNGIMLDLPISALGEWTYSAFPKRDTVEFEAVFRDEVERLAAETLSRVEQICSVPAQYRMMRREARRAAALNFDHVPAREFWDDLYEVSVLGKVALG